jgi:aspartate racemase
MGLHIGIVACSAEGAALCYRTICSEGGAAREKYDHPETTMHSHSFAAYMRFIEAGDWESVAELMFSSAEKVSAAGADFAICPDNTIHQAFDMVAERSPLPWLHIAEEVAAEAERRGYGRLGVMGTRFLMEGPVYVSKLGEVGIASIVPEDEERQHVDHIIFEELVQGIFTDESRSYLCGIIARLKERGCDAAVLGCTELPLIIAQEDSPLPILDSTRLLARGALREAFGGEG